MVEDADPLVGAALRAAARANAAGLEHSDWRADRSGGRGVHSADRAAGNAAVSGGKRGVAAGADSRWPDRWAWAILLWRYFPDARGSGVPQTKAALFARDGVITLGTCSENSSARPRRSRAEFRWDAKGLRCRWAAGIASVLGRRLGLRPASVKALIPIGAAAAIAAAFNTPLAAVRVFARRNHGRSERAGAGIRRAGVGDFLAGAAAAARQQSSVSGAPIPTGSSRRVSHSTRCWEWRADWCRSRSPSSCWRMRECFLQVAAMDGVVSTARGRRGHGIDGLAGAAGAGRGLRICRRRAE